MSYFILFVFKFLKTILETVIWETSICIIVVEHCCSNMVPRLKYTFTGGVITHNNPVTDESSVASYLKIALLTAS